MEILNAVRESVALKESRSYGPLIGHFEARKAVAEYSGVQDVTPDDVTICSGCSHAIDLVVTTLAEAGQNILPKLNWKVDLKSLENQIDENTVAIVVNNPSNPCGSVYDKEHLCEILDVASRNHLPIIADEIYEDFVFTNEQFVPIASLSKDVPVLTCSGLTKRFLVPGWRLGWVIIHDKNGILGKEVRKAMSNMSSRILGASTLIQQALPRILKCATHRSMYMMVEIKMSVFPEFTNELQFIKELCREQSVLCIPGH
ncbi:Tyrosine aminotransferase, partial [Operophtera brumata]